MNFPWDKYEYSDPFLVQIGWATAKYYMWRRNARTGQYKLKSCAATWVHTPPGATNTAPNPIELLPVKPNA